MAGSTTTGTQALRIGAADFRDRLAAGGRATVLDTRGQQAWESSGEKIQGAVRVSADPLRVSPDWPRDQLTVVY